MVCQFDRNDQCFEDCPQCSRYKAHYCDSCGGEFDRDDLVEEILKDFEVANPNFNIAILRSKISIWFFLIS